MKKRSKPEIDKFENYRDSVVDKAFEYSDKADECIRKSNSYKKQAKKNQMYHVYGIHLAGAMSDKRWYLSKAEKKMIWKQTQEEFSKPSRKDK